MSSAETELPPRPDSQTGEPWPPEPPKVLGLERRSAKPRASAGEPPEARGPGLAVQGDEWWSGFIPGVILSVITGGIFSMEDDEWFTDPFAWFLIGLLFLFTVVREWRGKLVAGADWFRVNRKWVDTYALTDIELRGVWFGWMLRLRDSEGRRVRTYMPDIEANRQLWALVYNGMLHSAFHGAKVNNVAAGALRLRPGFEAVRLQAERPMIPRRTVWTLLLVVAGVFAATYLFRPDLLGPALAIFAAIVLIALLAAGLAIAIMRRKQRRS